jgi:hypothetical protein
MKTLPIQFGLVCLLFSLFTLFTLQCAAQNDKRLFMELTPMFSNNVKHMPVENKLKNDIHIGNDQNEEQDVLDQSFYTSGLTTRFYFSSKTTWVFSVLMDYTAADYTGSIRYRPYDPYNDAWYTDTEKIGSITYDLGIGIGKQYYLDQRQRLVFLPELLIDLNGGFYDRLFETSSYTHSAQPNESGDRSAVGGRFNLKLNYRMTDYLGIGLSLNNITSIYAVNSSTTYGSVTAKRNYGEVTIAKTGLPRLSLVLYLDQKKKAE